MCSLDLLLLRLSILSLEGSFPHQKSMSNNRDQSVSSQPVFILSTELHIQDKRSSSSLFLPAFYCSGLLFLYDSTLTHITTLYHRYTVTILVGTKSNSIKERFCTIKILGKAQILERVNKYLTPVAKSLCKSTTSNNEEHLSPSEASNTIAIGPEETIRQNLRKGL